MKKTIPAIIIHGGAGITAKSRHPQKFKGMLESIRVGYKVLMETDNPVDAVEAAVKVMELDEVFNTGYGSVLARDGEVEMDAIIIRGSDLMAGAVGAIKHVAHPISVSRAVMEQTQHALLVGEGAEKFAQTAGFPLVESKQLTSPRALELLNKILNNEAAATTEIPLSTGEGGTVGAIAINSLGQLAAGTSTGGIAGKLPGRVGDTPMIGGGTICDDETCGASATGLGEAIMKACVCSKIADNLARGESPNQACLSALDFMKSRIPGSDGGAIVITKDGEIGYNFNSEKMSWAYINSDEGVLHYGIEKGDDFTTNI